MWATPTRLYTAVLRKLWPPTAQQRMSKQSKSLAPNFLAPQSLFVIFRNLRRPSSIDTQGGPDVTEPESSVDDHWFQVCFTKYRSDRYQGSVTSGPPCISVSCIHNIYLCLCIKHGQRHKNDSVPNKYINIYIAIINYKKILIVIAIGWESLA